MKSTSPSTGLRHRFPEAEGKHPWLRPLLDMYAAVDASVDAVLTGTGRDLVCSSGCHACCTQPIPASTLEIMGLRWYIHEVMPAEARDALLRRSPETPEPCPLLLEGVCSVYPVRPVSCRRYLVFDTRCAPGEMPTKTRPDDVIIPSRQVMEQAYAATGFFPCGQDPAEPVMSRVARRSVIVDAVRDQLFR